MEAICIEPNKLRDHVGLLQQGLPLTHGYHETWFCEGEQFVKSPNPAKTEWIMPLGAQPLKFSPTGRNAGPIPVVGDIEQFTTFTTGNVRIGHVIGLATIG